MVYNRVESIDDNLFLQEGGVGLESKSFVGNPRGSTRHHVGNLHGRPVQGHHVGNLHRIHEAPHVGTHRERHEAHALGFRPKNTVYRVPPLAAQHQRAVKSSQRHESPTMSEYATSMKQLLDVYATGLDIVDKLKECIDHGVIFFPLDIFQATHMSGGRNGKQRGGGLGDLFLVCLGVRKNKSMVVPINKTSTPGRDGVVVITPEGMTPIQHDVVQTERWNRIVQTQEAYGRVAELCNKLRELEAQHDKLAARQSSSSSSSSSRLSKSLDNAAAPVSSLLESVIHIPNIITPDQTLDEMIKTAQVEALSVSDFHGFRITGYIFYLLASFEKIALSLKLVKTLYMDVHDQVAAPPMFFVGQQEYCVGLDVFVSGLNFRFCAAAQKAHNEPQSGKIKVNPATWTSFVLHHPEGLDGPFRQIMSWDDLTRLFAQTFATGKAIPEMNVSMRTIIKAQMTLSHINRLFSGVTDYNEKIKGISELHVIGDFAKTVLYHPEMEAATVKRSALPQPTNGRANQVVPVIGLAETGQGQGIRGGALSKNFSLMNSRASMGSKGIPRDHVFMELLQMRRMFLVSYYDAINKSTPNLRRTDLPADYRELYTQRILFYDGSIQTFLNRKNLSSFNAKTPTDIRRHFKMPQGWTFDPDISTLWNEATEAHIKSFLIELHDYRLVWGIHGIENDSDVTRDDVIAQLDTLYTHATSMVYSMFNGYEGIPIKDLALMYRSADWQRLAILTFALRQCSFIRNVTYTCGAYTMVLVPNRGELHVTYASLSEPYTCSSQTDMNTILALFFQESVNNMLEESQYTWCSINVEFVGHVTPARREAFETDVFLNKAMFRYFIELYAGGLARNMPALTLAINRLRERA